MEEITRAECQANHKLISDQLKIMNDKLDAVMPTIKEINNIRNAWNYVGVWGATIAKIVIAVSVILGGIYAIKEWIKK